MLKNNNTASDFPYPTALQEYLHQEQDSNIKFNPPQIMGVFLHYRVKEVMMQGSKLPSAY
jgi:hypothetical protein